MYKAFIFDLDGTLTDTLDSLTYSVNATLKEMGLPSITEEECRSFVGNGAKVLVEESLRAAGDKNLERLQEGLAAYARIFDANCTYRVEPYEGIRSLLNTLKERGLKLAVLSNKPHRQAVRVTEEVFGKMLFDAVWGQTDDVPRKPDPKGALDIAAGFGVSPEETVYVGDSEVDVATGKAAGMKTVAVSWGFRSREELLQAGAELIADTAAELLAVTEEEDENE